MAVERKVLYKIYQSDGTYVKTLDDVASDFQVTNTINGGQGEFVLKLKRPFDGYNDDSICSYNNILKVYVVDDDNTSGTQVYTGYLVSIDPVLASGQEYVELTFLGAISKLMNSFWRSGTNTLVTKSGVDPSSIIEDAIDAYAATVSNSLVSYTAGSIDDTGNTATYDFVQKKYLEAIRKTGELLPYNWYFYCDATGTMQCHQLSVSADHTFTIGKDIKEIKVHKTIESLVNYLIFWNGKDGSDSNYILNAYEDSTSQSNYEYHEDYKTDGRVTVDGTADLMGNAVINGNKDPLIRTTIVVGSDYDLASIEPGDTCEIKNIGSTNPFEDNMKIVKVHYKVDEALIELAEFSADSNKIAQETYNTLHRRVSDVEEMLNEIDAVQVNESLQGWSSSLAFSVTDADTVAWAAGDVILSGGTTYSITSGNTGNMSALTYIYLDKDTSTTELQTTTTASDSVGDGKILIAVAENSSDEAIYQVFGGQGGNKITATQIEDSSITTSQIQANTITASDIAANTITANEIAANTITGTEITANTKISINDTTFGNDGIQLDYNSGDPRFYAGNGNTGDSARYFKFDGTDLSWKAQNTELDTSGNLTASNATIRGTLNADDLSAGSLDVARISDHSLGLVKTGIGNTLNACLNPSFEQGSDWWDISNWEGNIGKNGNARSGEYFLYTDNLSGSEGTFNANGTKVECFESDVWFMKVYYRTPYGASATGRFAIRILWLDEDRNVLETSTLSSAGHTWGGWLSTSGSASAPSGAAYAQPQIFFAGFNNSENIWQFDDVYFTRRIEYLDADYITAGTLTGRTVQTASSGSRVVVDGSNNRLDIYDSSNLVSRLSGSSLELYGDNANIYFNSGKTAYISDSGAAGGYVTFYGGGQLELGGNSKYLRWGQTGYEDGIKCDAKIYDQEGIYVDHSLTSSGSNISVVKHFDMNQKEIKDVDKLYVDFIHGATNYVYIENRLDMQGNRIVDTPIIECTNNSGQTQIWIQGNNNSNNLYWKDTSDGDYFEAQHHRRNDQLQWKSNTSDIVNFDKDGDAHFQHAVSKASGSFNIAHPDPSKPEGTRLRHCFVESPTAGDNIYRYEVEVKDGKAEIELPDYFKHLNENPQAWVSPVDVLGIARAECTLEKVVIEASKDGKYNVLVIGTRKDEDAVAHWEEYGIEYIREKRGDN